VKLAGRGWRWPLSSPSRKRGGYPKIAIPWVQYSHTGPLHSTSSQLPVLTPPAPWGQTLHDPGGMVQLQLPLEAAPCKGVPL
jgi:hypothetical protein